MKLKKESEEQLKAEDMEAEHRLEWKKKVRAFRQVQYNTYLCLSVQSINTPLTSIDYCDFFVVCI